MTDITKLIGYSIMFAFYGAYIIKSKRLKKKGITVNQMAKGTKEQSTSNFEFLLKIATLILIALQLVSVKFYIYDKSLYFLRIIGFLIAISGVVCFIMAITAMKDSWRAGINTEEKTKLITSGIYRHSRNPAFLGFYLFYIGMALSFFNIGISLGSLVTIMMLHRQVLEEEKHLPGLFGHAYKVYREKTPRYYIK